MMAYYDLPYQSRTWYRGDGTTLDFLCTFAGGNHLDRSHVSVYIDGAALSSSAWSFVVINGQDYIRFTTPPALRYSYEEPNIMFKRVTPGTADNRAVDFEGGSLLKAEDLDKAVLNALYVSQESADLFLDQGGAAVNVNQPQEVGGEKTFTDGIVIDNVASLKFEPGTPISKVVNGEQYVLAASTIDGVVEWQKTSVSAENLPSSVVQADYPPTTTQEISAPKRFLDITVPVNGLKISGGTSPVKDKALVCLNASGTMTLTNIVNGIRRGSNSSPIETGVVLISPATIGALPANTDGGATQTVSTPVNFTSNISLGDNASADTLTINSTLKIVSPSASAGKVLTCTDPDGSAAWLAPANTGITSVNGQTGSGTGGAITLTASDLNAVSVDTAQNINGAKTFTNNVNLGVDAFDTITIAGELYIPSTGTFGQVLTRTDAGKAIWQTPEPAGVSSVNGASGAVTITAASLDAYTSQTIPTATTGQKGIMQVGSGLSVTNGVVSVSQNAQLPIASATVLGGVKVGSNLAIDPVTGVLSAGITGTSGVTTFNSRSGDVSPTTGDYTAAQVTNAVTTNSAQDITASKKFTANQSVSAATPTVGTNGSSGVLLNTSGLIQAQRTAANDRIFQGHAPAGGVSSYIESDGTAWFDGLVTAQAGFFSPGGMTIGDNTSDGINITGTLKITGNGSPASGKVLTCTNTSGNVEWQTPSNAPVTDVNGLTGNVKISIDGEANPTGNLGGVTKGTNQVISGIKTFSVQQNFQAGVELGNDISDIINVRGALRIPTDQGVDKVLTCTDATTGAVAWRPPRVNSVRGVAQTSGMINDVVIAAADVGAPTVAELNTVASAVSTASAAATAAQTTANQALTVANGKLSAVSTDVTIIDGNSFVCLNGDGTAGNKLKVAGAPPLGPAGGSLTGSYPNPTIGAKQVSFTAIQDVPALSVLVGPTTGTAAGRITTVSIGSGLGIATVSGEATLANTNQPDAKLGTTNTWTAANTFTGAVTFGSVGSATFNNTLTANGNVTLGNASGDTITINGATTISSTGALKITPGAAAGKVLTSDGSGNATWADAPASSYTPTITMIGASQTFRANNSTTIPFQPGTTFTSVAVSGQANQKSIRSTVGTWRGVAWKYDGNTLSTSWFDVVITTTSCTVTYPNGFSGSYFDFSGWGGPSNPYIITVTRTA
jgi:hypothetical protein